MGFFKDFKEDLSETVNGLSDQKLDNGDDVLVNTLDDPELAKMAEKFKEEAETDDLSAENKNDDIKMAQETVSVGDDNGEAAEANDDDEEITDETAIITTGLKVTGDLNTTGSIDVFGVVEGSVTCRGKLTVNGSIAGDSKANEIFANNAQIDGNVEAKGSIKIGQGTVIVGNITASSAVVAGAVKGDIDVKGPVIVDSSAVIVGDIKSKTVQINNGATIDGRCSQCYAEVDMDALFNIKKNK
ncbi:MAG: polymer-forming cytoskeletal protein [Eubacteriales bacterium]|nr:polymer-forming cytoskeletal protein [Eubacteriales bacterium]